VLLEVTPEELAGWLSEQGEPAYRAGQVLEWVFRKFADSFERMTDLPARLRRSLGERCRLGTLPVVGESRSEDGLTRKVAFALDDGEVVEGVLMAGRRPTFCISSQAGCAMGCTFCATGAAGFARSLRAWEVLAQVAGLARAAGGMGNIVFMGMGEPLANLEAVIPALDALCDERRFGLGARRITVSTCGLTPGVRRLARCRVHPNLALSLNSPFQEQRAGLMPVARRFPLPELLDACEEYARRSGRRVALEYVMLSGVNTSRAAALAVARIARRLRALVNLVAFNPFPGSRYRTPGTAEVRRFRQTLASAGVVVTQRFSRGRRIGAGCGQLAGARSAAGPGRGGRSR